MATIRDLFLDRKNGIFYDSFTSGGTSDLSDFYVGDDGLILHVHNIEPASNSTQNPGFPFKYVDPGTDTIAAGLGDINESSTGGTGSLVDPNTEATSGALIVGIRYKIVDYNAGDDFANAGGTNVTGNIFTASNTTPTNWTNASTLIEIVDALDYNVTAAVFQAAIRAKLSRFATATVAIGEAANPWTIDRVAFGDGDPLEGIPDGLTPDSVILVQEIREGNTERSQRMRIRFIEQPAAFGQSTGYLPAASVTPVITRAGSAGVNQIQRITFPSGTYGGYITIQSTTLGVAHGTTAATGPLESGMTDADFETVINAAFLAGNEVTVYKVDDFNYDVIFTGTNVAAYQHTVMTADVSGLQVPMGWIIDPFSTNVAGAFDLLGIEDSVQTTFEIEETDIGGLTKTLFQGPAVLNGELISALTAGGTTFPGFITIAMFALITQRTALTITAAATSEVTIPKNNKFMTVDAAVGTGSYTHNIDLASVAADRIAGDKCEVILRMDAGFTGAGLINIRNDTGSTVLWPEAGVSAAFTRNLFFTWTGSAWTSDQ